MNSMVEAASSIALAVIGLAVVAVLVSKNANTSGVIQASASGLANNIGAAISPVTGTSLNLSLGYPGGNSFGYGFGS